MSDSEDSDDISLPIDKLFRDVPEQAAALQQYEDDLDIQLAIASSLQANNLYYYTDEDDVTFPEELLLDEDHKDIRLAIAMSLETSNPKYLDGRQNQLVLSEDDDSDSADSDAVVISLATDALMLIGDSAKTQKNSTVLTNDPDIINAIDEAINNLSTTINPSASQNEPECNNTNRKTKVALLDEISSIIEEEIENLVAQDIASKNKFECNICLSKHDIKNSGSFGCSHLFCTSCLSDFLKGKLEERAVNGVECPAPTCKNTCTEQLFREYLPPNLIEKYEESIMLANVEALPEIYFCPQCNFPVQCELDLAIGTCSKCLYTFCTSCRKAFHGCQQCEDGQDNKAKEEEIRKSEQLINERFKKCPGCETSIEKDTIGCHHMKCAKCKTEFCWLCLTILSCKMECETHYRSYCILFDHDFVVD